jgi:hypothetical protein
MKRTGFNWAICLHIASPCAVQGGIQGFRTLLLCQPSNRLLKTEALGAVFAVAKKVLAEGFVQARC